MTTSGGESAISQYAGQRILANLAGEKKVVLDVGEKVVIIANDLSPPIRTADENRQRAGFCHGYRGKDFPYGDRGPFAGDPRRCGFGEHYPGCPDQRRHHYRMDPPVWSSSIPDPEVQRRYADKKRLYEAAQDDLLDSAHLPAVTKDHHCVEIGGNIEFVEEIPSAIAPRGGWDRTLSDGIYLHQS